jgi:phosphoribosylaminoimidazole-succinocarboxamide synthase
MNARTGLLESHISGLELIARGKVRDIYRVDDEYMLIVASDRLSAFDVVLPDPIPGKGEVLTRLSNFWMREVAGDIPNHLSAVSVADVVLDSGERAALGARALVVRRLDPLPVEAIVRGYLIGSGWKDYQANGEISGVALPAGLVQADQLPSTIFTPSSKAAVGAHDENISFERMCQLVGREDAEQVREMSVRIYERAARHARNCGIIIADTKFEFGRAKDGSIVLIDEVLTPDSSRFWPADAYSPGRSPPSFDKQFVRDYLETLDWDKTPPAPSLPADILERTSAKYAEAEARLSGPGSKS